MAARICLQCGMTLDVHTVECPKCDNNLELQTDGTTLTVDIAHNGERAHEALDKMELFIALAKESPKQFVRLIVGGGIIREEVRNALVEMESRSEIKSFQHDARNAGVIIIRLK